jgi:hypothetical protein
MISIADEEIDRIAFAFKIELVSFILKTRKSNLYFYCLLPVSKRKFKDHALP